MSSDDPEFGGYGLVDKSVPHFTRRDPLFEKDQKEWLLLYLPARTAQILRRKKPEEIGTSEPSEKVEKAPGKKTDAKPAAGKKAATKPATRAPRAKKESGK